jgi:hypothetical protein
MRVHTITTKPSTIVLGGILALSLAVVLLAATASTASAERLLDPWYCEPQPTQTTTLEQIPQECRGEDYVPIDVNPPVGVGAPFGDFEGFGDRQVGTTSPAQGFALAVCCNDTFNPRISVSGDYAQTNNCPPTLSVTGEQIQGCIITVTFAPTGTGPRDGTLSTGPGGPTFALTGAGVTTPTPWDWPLELRADVVSNTPYPVMSQSTLEKGKPKVPLRVVTNNDSTVVVSGGVKKTTKRLAAGKETKIKPKLNLKRLKVKPVPKVKGVEIAKTEIKFAATDEFDETATERIKVTFCVGTERDCT